MDFWKKSYQGERIDIKPFELNNGKVVINPLANYKQEQVSEYFTNNQLPVHPLTKEGYLSVGCTNCTFKASDRNNPRAGGGWIKQKLNVGFITRKISYGCTS